MPVLVKVTRALLAEPDAVTVSVPPSLAVLPPPDMVKCAVGGCAVAVVVKL